MIRLSLRRLARQVARDAWIKSKQQGDTARSLFESDPRLMALDPATVLALLQIALLLWEWWRKRKIEEPSIVAMSDEPVDLETEDDE